MSEDANREHGAGAGTPGKSAEVTCAEALVLAYEFLDGELDPEATDRVRRHLETCRRCHPYFHFERLFLDRVHDTGGEGRAGPDLERRVRAVLERDGSRAPGVAEDRRRG